MMRVPNGCLTPVLAGLVLALSTGGALAEGYDVDPGLWQIDTVATFEGPIDIPEERESDTLCITPEDVDEGPFLDLGHAPEGCSKDLTRNESGMIAFTTRCNIDDDKSVRSEYAINLHGDRVDGSMESVLSIRQGEMYITMHFEGKRLGACD